MRVSHGATSPSPFLAGDVQGPGAGEQALHSGQSRAGIDEANDSEDEADEDDVEAAPEFGERGSFGELLDMFDARLAGGDLQAARSDVPECAIDAGATAKSSSSSSSSSSDDSDSSSTVEEQALVASPPVVAPQLAESVGGASTCGQVLAELVVGGGRLAVYHNNNFVAYCGNANHGRCIPMRTRLPGRKAAQGRPCVLLKAWFACAFNAEITSKEEHMRAANLPSFDARSSHRAQLSALPGCADLLSHEREARASEGPEPATLP